MAPARMMQFVDQHVKNCPICKNDLILPEEVEKIREYVLPESKIPKSIRSPEEGFTPEISPDEEDEELSEKETDAFGEEESEEDLEEDDLDEDDII